METHVLTLVLVSLHAERGVEYVFSLRARNSLDYGEQAVESITTPEGSESRNPIGQQNNAFISLDGRQPIGYLSLTCRLVALMLSW